MKIYIFIETNLIASKNLKERREMMMKNNFANEDQGTYHSIASLI